MSAAVRNISESLRTLLENRLSADLKVVAQGALANRDIGITLRLKTLSFDELGTPGEPQKVGCGLQTLKKGSASSTQISSDRGDGRVPRSDSRRRSRLAEKE
jgi:hypothetical protein